MTVVEKPTAAFILSLVAGVLILAGGLFGVAAWLTWGGMAYRGGWSGMMGWWNPWVWYAFSLIGLVSGIAITAGALVLQSHPAQAQAWGTVILVFSVVSVFGMGGFLLGALLGILGGILALTWKPHRRWDET
ncbi:MAG: hypothetical protein RMH74_04810 [Candidatus Caldarchaeum sp.]|nr:hypothetical protein [Candidatus Caldarchaeum sp.]